MSSPSPQPARFHWKSPAAILPLAAVAVAALLLALPVRLPIGAMYWDHVIYLDGASRVLSGQVPSADFFAPAGPLAYWLTALALAVFPDAQSVLLAGLPLLLITGPLMAVAAADIARRDTVTAIALVAVFLFFALLPFNTSAYYPFPGTDGFAIYNRQGSQLLYVLVTALVLVRDERARTAVVAITMTALFLVKVTAFLAGGLICLLALIAGRVSIRQAVAAGIVFIGLLGIAEMLTGAVSAYVRDILVLVGINSGGLAPRLVQAVSRTFSTTAAASVLALALLAWNRPKGGAMRAAAPGLWVGVTLAAGLFYESQNTGGQELIFLWPAILAALPLLAGWLAQPGRLAVAAIAAAVALLVPLANTAQSAARALAGLVRDEPLNLPGMRALDDVTVRPEVLERARFMLAAYAEDQADLKAMAQARQLPAPLIFSDPDFQAGWMIAVSDAVTALNTLEAKGLAYSTVMTVDFVNPFPFLLGRQAPRAIAIGADPFRAVPPLNAETRAAIEAADIVLRPLCPYTVATKALEDIYAPALAGRTPDRLTPCYDMLLKPGITLPAMP